MKIIVNILLLFIVLPCFSQKKAKKAVNDSIVIESDTLSGKKIKKEKFIDYFSLMPKAIREYTPSDYFQAYDSMTINSIEVYVVNRFDDPVYNQDDFSQIKIEDNKRSKHSATLVRKQLLFNVDQEVDPQLIADTERNIRENTIYKDAVIVITPTPHIEGVDVQVYAHDNRHWRAVFWGTPTSLTMGGTFYDFFGIAQATGFYGSGLIDPRNPYNVGAFYKVNNIAKSQISLEFDYNRQNLSQSYGVELKRKFYAYNTKWAGKAQFSNNYRKIEYNNIDNKYNNKYFSSELWLARSFALKNMNKKWPTMRFLVSARGSVRENYTIPKDQPVQNFVNKQIYLGSIGLANRDWYGFEELYRFRNFDYVPKGFNLAVIGGYEINDSLGGRFYSGFTLNYSKQYPKFGFMKNEFSYGNFTRNAGVEQISIQLITSYFTNRAKLGKLGFRQFININSTLSFNRPNSEYYNIGTSAIKGFDSQKLIGTKSLVVNLESVFYTPVHWWTSKGNFFLFADVGLLGRSNADFLFNNILYQGYGGGIRFQNLKLGVNYLELAIGYYPTGYIVQEKNWGFQVGENLPRTIEENNLFTPGIISDIY